MLTERLRLPDSDTHHGRRVVVDHLVRVDHWDRCDACDYRNGRASDDDASLGTSLSRRGQGQSHETDERNDGLHFKLSSFLRAQ